MVVRDGDVVATFGSTARDQAVAGFLAGTVSTLALHPLDLAKITQQVSEVRAEHWWRVLPAHVRSHGLPSLYRGLGANLVGSASSWALFFYFYSILKGKLEPGTHDDSDRTNKDGSNASSNTTVRHDKLGSKRAGAHLFASAVAGAATCFFTNPLFVVKSRMLTQLNGQPDSYSGVFHGLKTIYRLEGIPGLYKGLAAALIGVSHGAVQFMVYESLKDHWSVSQHNGKIHNNSEKLGTIHFMSFAAISKIIATVTCYRKNSYLMIAYQVIKSRIQVQQSVLRNKYSTIRGAVFTIWKNERLAGFYKGLGVNIIRVLPSTVITFGVYEAVSKYLRSNS